MKRGFTLIELVFVILIIGILSAVLAPRFNRPTLTEAAHQLVSHIRYTQHLAMVDDKFDRTRSTWFKDRWQLRFSRTVDSKIVWSYTIFSDDSNHDGNPNIGDTIARNPSLTSDYLSGGASGVISLTDERRMKEMALGEKYGVKWVSFSRSCSHQNPPADNQSRRILFDNIGRPYWRYSDDSAIGTNPYSDMDLVETQCIITLCDTDKCEGGEQIEIAIEPETGYTHIL